MLEFFLSLGAPLTQNVAVPYITAFDTSCFSGEYVTGESIGDEYFTKLYDLRNEKAKLSRNGTAGNSDAPDARTQQSNDGCESVNNDTRMSTGRQDSSCESLSNNQA